MTAHLVIEKLKSIGYQVRTDGRDILLSADRDPDPELATALLTELRHCKAEAVRLLQSKSEAWPAEVKTLVDWFLTATTQEAPFQLNSCTRVINSELFYAALRREIERGPSGARARYGTLQGDLVDLAKLQ